MIASTGEWAAIYQKTPTGGIVTPLDTQIVPVEAWSDKGVPLVPGDDGVLTDARQVTIEGCTYVRVSYLPRSARERAFD